MQEVMEPILQIQVLGKFTLRYGETVISDEDDRSRKVWAVLAYLIYHREKIISQQELVDLCWGEDTRSSDPHNALKSAIHRIRATLDKLQEGLGRTLLRREFRQRESLVQVGALTLNTVTREVSGRGEPLPLTPREFAILEHLMLHRGCWISQEELMEHIWEADANPFSNAVRMHISSLRKKLRKRLGHDPIQTKVGRGYRLAGEETA